MLPKGETRPLLNDTETIGVPFNKMSTESWGTLSASEADWRVAQAVCCWPTVVQFDPILDGVDFSVIMRQHLWPIVSAAARQHRGAKSFDKIIQEQDLQLCVPRNSGWARAKNLFGRSKTWLKTSVVSKPWASARRRTILVPFPHHSWQKTMSACWATGLKIKVATPVAHRLNAIRSTRQATQSGLKFADGLVNGLKHFAISLSSNQQDKIRRTSIRVHATVLAARQTLKMSPPCLLITNTSATSPTIEYVLVARHLGIPTLAIQYGLDCDRFAYDDAHAKNIAVWSEVRQQQYETLSAQAPSRIVVCGNPEYDHLETEEWTPQTTGDYWLWATRPHLPRSCKLASDAPAQGLNILQILLDTLRAYPARSLRIKPHPNDYAGLYRQLIGRSDLSDRVTVENRPLRSLLPNASLVVTEDTTAGMDALLYRKPTIHVRFSETPPILPFVKYGAALQGFSPHELTSAIAIAESDHQSAPVAETKEFLRDFAGPTDGTAGQRLSNFIGELVQP